MNTAHVRLIVARLLAMAVSALLPATSLPSEAGVAAAAEPPYPPSPVIERIEFDFATHKRLAPGSDNWPTTWADDDQEGKVEVSTFYWNFPTKWFGADGTSCTLVFTGKNSNDSWNTVVRGRFVLRPRGER